MRSRLFVTSLLLPTILSLAVCANAFGVQYTVTDLGTFGGSMSMALGINSSGQVVGYAQNSEGFEHAFLYSGGTMTDLGTLGGDNSKAWAINDSGVIAGTADTTTGFRAFRYVSGSITNLGTLGGDISQGVALNSDGDVVGTAATPQITNLNRAALWSGDSSAVDLGHLPVPEGMAAEAFAYGINDSGKIVGNSTSANGLRAFLYESGGMTDLGSFGGSEYGSDARGINNAGQIVGWADTGDGSTHAFLYENGAMSDLGTLGGALSHANGINSDGLIVGSASTEAEATDAFLYTGTGMVDLNTLIVSAPNWTLIEAHAINDSGQIVGYGTHNGETRAFLLTPLPEPSTLVLSGMAAAAAVLATWRRRRNT